MSQTDPAPLPVALHRKAARRVHPTDDSLPRGLDFTRSDPLGLAHPPALPHPGPAVEARLARFCQMPSALVFASATQAVQATLASLLRPGDEVILDAALPQIYAAAVHAAGARAHRCPPASVPGVERRLARLSQKRGRRFVCVPGLSDLTALSADLGDLIPLCSAHGATLILDISSDLGVLGPTGRGLAEHQGRLGQCDVLIGSLAGTLGVPAGLAATHEPLPGAHSLPPDQAAALAFVLDLVSSDEGRRRRQRLHGNSQRLRNHLTGEGLRLLGHPAPTVPIPLPPGQAGQMSALLASAGPLVPLIAAPQVGRHHPRWLVRLSSDHSLADIDNLADVIVDVTRATRLRA